MKDHEIDEHLPNLNEAEILTYKDIKYEDLGFADLPSRLQALVIAYDLSIDARPPSESERLETVSDALEHRIIHKELNVKDYLNHYQGIRNKNHVI